jgi:hypothetical protein
MESYTALGKTIGLLRWTHAQAGRFGNISALCRPMSDPVADA